MRNPEPLPAFPEYLRQAIPAMGYRTPTEFARAAGISSSVVSRWLNGVVRPDVPLLERTIKQAILRFEPRVMEDSLDVKALEPSSVLDTHNVIEFEIRGFMWAQPVPLELLLRTQVDLEAGQIEVRDAASGSLKRKT